MDNAKRELLEATCALVRIQKAIRRGDTVQAMGEAKAAEKRGTEAIRSRVGGG